MLIILIAAINCGHKAAPLAKDRLKPRLVKVSALNRNQLQCTFSEPIDTTQLGQDAIIISTADETLQVLASYPTLSAAEIMFAVDTMQKIEYQITGYVYDTAINKGNFTKRFMGADLPDTIKPSIAKYPQGKGVKIIELIFSEAIDTTRSGFILLPKTEYSVKWNGMRSCSIDSAANGKWLSDSLIYYLYSSNQTYDLNNNALYNFLTVFTPDTSYLPIFLEGKAVVNDTLIKDGIAVLFRDEPIGISIVSQGIFKFEVRDSIFYQVTVLAGQYSGSGQIIIDGENNIELKLKTIDLDDIIN